MVSANEITIQLPAGWGPAYGDVDFGTAVLADLPSVEDRAMSSYVVLQSPYPTAADARHPPCLLWKLPMFSGDGVGEVTLMVTGVAVTDGMSKMSAGDIITLTYYNVRVQSLTARQLTAEEPVKAQLGVYDTTVGLQDTVLDNVGKSTVWLTCPVDRLW